MRQYMIICLENCQWCNGAGHIEHPSWKRLRRERGIAAMSNQEIEAWFFANGYDAVPSEDYRCPDCDGAGHTREEVPLAEAVAELTSISDACAMVEATDYSLTR